MRAAICESIGRLPYATAAQAETAERALLEMASTAVNVTDRLGVAKGLEAYARIQRKLRPPGDDAVTRLRRLSELAPREAATGARVRRLAIEALITVAAVDDETLQKAASDPDAQVRRIAMHAAVAGGSGVTADLARRVLASGLKDDSAPVRLEALKAVRARSDADACSASLIATHDRDTNVALVGLDQLAACPVAAPSATAAAPAPAPVAAASTTAPSTAAPPTTAPPADAPVADPPTASTSVADPLPASAAASGGAQDANAPAAPAVDSLPATDGVVATLERAVADLSAASVPRGWHRAAHALVALAQLAPDSATAALPQFTAVRSLAAADVRGACGDPSGRPRRARTVRAGR